MNVLWRLILLYGFVNKSERFSSLDGFFPECPVHKDLFLINFFSIHFFDCVFCLLIVLIFDKSITFGIAGFSVHVEMNAFDLSVFAEGVVNVILLTLFVEIGDNDDPSFDSWVRELMYIWVVQIYLISGWWLIRFASLINLCLNLYCFWLIIIIRYNYNLFQ